MMNVDGIEYLSTKEAAAYLGIGIYSLHDACARHPERFQTRKISGGVFWTVECIRQYDTHRRQSWQWQSAQTKKESK